MLSFLKHEGFVAWRDGHVPPQQIGQHAAFVHLALNRSRWQRNADRTRLALAKLIFQDAQGLIERGDEKIDDTVAESVFLCGAIVRCYQRRGAGNVGRHDQRTARVIQLTRIEEFAAEASFRGSMRGFSQLCVGLRYVCDEVESSRR